MNKLNKNCRNVKNFNKVTVSVVKDFNIPLLVSGISSRLKINKDLGSLK